MGIATAVEREIMNLHGGFTLKESFVLLPAISMMGVHVVTNENDANFTSVMAAACDGFFKRTADLAELNQEVFYSVVTCSGEQDGQYKVFFGKELLRPSDEIDYQIPEGWYAKFSYHGDMADMRLAFTDDYYRWLVAKEIEIIDNGIGMVNIYDAHDTQNVQVLVPVRNSRLKHK